MKSTAVLLVSIAFSFCNVAAGAVDETAANRAEAPSATRAFDPQQLGPDLEQIARGTSALSPRDQSRRLESALRNLVRASTPGGGKADAPGYFSSGLPELNATERDRLDHLAFSYFGYLNPKEVREARDPILSVVAIDGFLLHYTALKLVALHDRLNLGWHDSNVAWALPTLLMRGAEQAALTFVKHGAHYALDRHLQLLAALRTEPGLAPGPELRAGLLDFTRTLDTTLADRLAAPLAAQARRKIDLISFVFSTSWLATLAVTSPLFAYQVVNHGAPEMFNAHPAAFVAQSMMLTVMPALLSVVSYGRMRERRTTLETTVKRFANGCAQALN